jgi:RNA methyltransferase, TrmH family
MGAAAMATRLGIRAERLAAVRALRTVKGRRNQHRFAFEGATMLADAAAVGIPITDLYATEDAYESTPLARELEGAGTPVFIISESAAASISDLATPTGLVAVTPVRLQPVEKLFEQARPLLILADLNDPANVGTLLRTADALGCPGVLFGRLGIDPHHPKVARASMGAIFRLEIGVGEPQEAALAAEAAGARILGLSASGIPLEEEGWEGRTALVVGNERHGLGAWEGLCERLLAIPMRGRAESLSAAAAGSIALYEASRKR